MAKRKARAGKAAQKPLDSNCVYVAFDDGEWQAVKRRSTRSSELERISDGWIPKAVERAKNAHLNATAICSAIDGLVFALKHLRYIAGYASRSIEWDAAVIQYWRAYESLSGFNSECPQIQELLAKATPYMTELGNAIATTPPLVSGRRDPESPQLKDAVDQPALGPPLVLLDKLTKQQQKMCCALWRPRTIERNAFVMAVWGDSNVETKTVEKAVSRFSTKLIELGCNLSANCKTHMVELIGSYRSATR